MSIWLVELMVNIMYLGDALAKFGTYSLGDDIRALLHTATGCCSETRKPWSSEIMDLINVQYYNLASLHRTLNSEFRNAPYS